ncbi:phage recombination protein Bet [Xylanimonas cellulosilytica DSM 15894]|uniref:Phage recombination protein Bet n=1 Tax=Xylanimonas cellulosilytica (strain DSM 15894 / JCM 12276 / CECT 5975 / KCTC 9989 / LMG 20990 / NBRC 107835 / XIL07) TaxID=446471 RepID=D1BWP7_XYLCX|nr:phage recombination protein Bet [Xylanimonas cellulosilytica]ACZ29629.1 phage recombination protein Bet [Xylanimonas cellulosilytica DSM 15894]
MSTEIVTRGPSSDLAITDGQSFFTDKQVAALRQLGVSNATNADLAVFFHQSTRTGLDPFARQIYMIERQGKQTIQTGIDGFRLVARRATDRARGSFGYEDTLWCGPDGSWTDVWLSREAPAAAKVTVIRDGARYPAIALYTEYVALKRDGNPNSMWASKPALMLAKCAEALALRKAFPQDLSGLYTSDEMQQADNTPADGGFERVSPRSGSAKLAAAVQERSRQVQAVPDAVPEEIHDAEVIEDAVPHITREQSARLRDLMREAGLNRASMLTLASEQAGRPVTAATDLTEAEAAAVITLLEAVAPPAEPAIPEDVFGGREPQTAAS